ncbi:MAG: ATP-binding protein [Planctomycetaceae bacterium]|nr:ATP-binding protein [Planctomycetaceae bacterium]
MGPQDAAPSDPHPPYEMRISRLTVDKLGVKLYDKASAVVAELVANSYDADAENVQIRIPLGTLLARKAPNGQPTDEGYVIEVIDDGHGMSPEEAIAHFLTVGRDRRRQVGQGSLSRTKRRPVMGRKGIGKLAPFGICKRIEILSSGGPRTANGYLTAHFVLDFDEIMKDDDEPVRLDPGERDGTYAEQSGTTVKLSQFLPKRVPDATTFHRQLSRRFQLSQPDFATIIVDSRDPATNPPKKVEAFVVPAMPNTTIQLDGRPVTLEDGVEMPVTGWIGLAKEAYRDEEMAGIRIYARGKIVATTRDFEQPAGFTGEFTIRSYVVGEVHAEWLDMDDGEDLVRTDRQSILWDSDFGMALRDWGMGLIREVGRLAKAPRRARVEQLFLEASRLEEMARQRFSDQEMVDAAVDLAKQIGRFASEDELADPTYVKGLADVILAVAPHKALIDALQSFSTTVTGVKATIEQVADLFGKTRIAELASYSQIASERVRAIRTLERHTTDGEKDEGVLQKIIASAPWLVQPSFTLITQNQALKTFSTQFAAHCKRTGIEVPIIAIDGQWKDKRPDFIFVTIGLALHVVEIKAIGHVFDDKDFQRLHNYVVALEAFFKSHKAFEREFGDWRIDLIADAVKFTSATDERAYISLEKDKRLFRRSWVEFLLEAKKAHEQFLEVHDKATPRP